MSWNITCHRTATCHQPDTTHMAMYTHTHTHKSRRHVPRLIHLPPQSSRPFSARGDSSKPRLQFKSISSQEHPFLPSERGTCNTLDHVVPPSTTVTYSQKAHKASRTTHTHTHTHTRPRAPPPPPFPSTRSVSLALDLRSVQYYCPAILAQRFFRGERDGSFGSYATDWGFALNVCANPGGRFAGDYTFVSC